MRRHVRAATAVAAATIARHPRHVVLFAAVAGLLAGAGPRLVAPAVAVCAALAGLAARRRSLALLAALAVVASAVVADLRIDALDNGALARAHGRPLSTEAIVLEPVRERAGGPAVARVRLLGAPFAGAGAVLRIRPEVHAGAWPGVGEIVALRGRVAPLGRYDRYQRRRGAGAAVDVAVLRRTGRRRGGVAGAIDAIRRRAERGLQRGVAERESALLLGMVLGQDERLDPVVKTDFQRSGLAHILAVSGQNVMLLATLVLGVAAAAGLPLRRRLGLALALIAIYVPLAGGGPSIQRAGVMGGAGLVAALAGRASSRWYALALAAAATLALNPLAAGDAGWQLSFAAVVSLLAFAPPLRIAMARRIPGAVADAAAITIAATVGTAPLMALHFEQVSLASLPANLLAAAAIAPIMWLGMVGAAAAQVAPALALPFTALSAPLLAYVAWIAHVASAAPLAVLPLRLGSPASLAVAYAVLAGLAAGAIALSRRRRAAGTPPPETILRRRTAAVVLAAVAAVAAIVALAPRGGPAPPARGELVVSFLDIGQGDATLLQRDGASVLVDTGPPEGSVVKRLADAGVRRLDALVLTHAQRDHEGAALAVMRAYAPRLLLNGGAGWPSAVQRELPAAVRAAGTRAVTAEAGQSLTIAGMCMRLLWPPRPPPGWVPEGDANDRAIVALVQVGDFDLFLPADAESNVTGALRLPRVEAIKVAHHGSADDGLPALLDRLRPRFAAIEVGRRNTYGHPAASTLAALRGVDDLVRTDRDGTVRLRVRGGTMRFERAGGLRLR
jgi:competence protein ComEC